MVFKNICILVLWTKVASALEGLKVLPIVVKHFANHFQKFPDNTYHGSLSIMKVSKSRMECEGLQTNKSTCIPCLGHADESGPEPKKTRFILGGCG